MNAFTSPRARRPVNARVIAVSPPAASARRWARSCPPRARAGRRFRSAPAAAPAAERREHAVAIGDSAGRDERHVDRALPSRAPARAAARRRRRCPPSCPRWPPASAPCTTSTSAPAATAARASATLVTVSHTSAPAARTRSSVAALGQPKVNEIDRRSGVERERRAFASNSSSSKRGSPSGTPQRAASGCSSSAYGVDRCVVDRLLAQREEVDAERRIGERASAFELLGERGRRQIARAEERQTAGIPRRPRPARASTAPPASGASTMRFSGRTLTARAGRARSRTARAARSPGRARERSRTAPRRARRPPDATARVARRSGKVAKFSTSASESASRRGSAPVRAARLLEGEPERRAVRRMQRQPGRRPPARSRYELAEQGDVRVVEPEQPLVERFDRRPRDRGARARNCCSCAAHAPSLPLPWRLPCPRATPSTEPRRGCRFWSASASRRRSPHPRAQAERVAEQIDGRRLESVTAHGKNLVLRFEGGVVVRSHLRISGRWTVRPRGQAARGTPWLVLRGERAEGVLWNGPVLELHTRALARLGPDILERPPRIDAMLARLQRGRRDALVRRVAARPAARLRDREHVAGRSALGGAPLAVAAARRRGRGRTADGARDGRDDDARVGRRRARCRQAGLSPRRPAVPALPHADQVLRAGR